MGGSHSLPTYAVPVEGSATPGSSSIYRAATHPSELVDSLQGENIKNCWDVFQLGLRKKGNGPFLGTRTKNRDGTLGAYRWRSYSEVEKLAKNIGSGLMNLKCLPKLQFPEEPISSTKEMRLLGIYSKNREEWFVCEQAANAYDFALVPLYDTLGAEALNFILNQTGLPTVVCTSESINGLLGVAKGTKLSKIICLDDLSDEIVGKVKEQGVELLTWKEVLESGKSTPRKVKPGNMDSMHTICYTSGTTGDPKGVIHTQRNFVSTICAALRGPIADKDLTIDFTDYHISYLPLAHVFERIICSLLIAQGASIGIYAGDTLKLLDDIRELRPTIFVSVPRLFNRINDKVFGNLTEKSAVVQYLFNSGLNAKLANLRKTGKTTHPFWDSLVFNKTKAFMGGRLRYMCVGGAPLAPIVQERMSVLFCCPLLEGFGMTETMGASFVQLPSDPSKGSVGGVVPSLEFKLQSVPEMDYLVTSNPPKGECCIRGPSVTPGYFKNPQQTAETIDKDGWLHTGDVCVLLPSGALKIIDRAKNMFKLSQGEYVAPEKVEQVYQQAFLVAQVFCFGYSTKPSLVGVVVPDTEMAEKWAAKNGMEKVSFEDICASSQFKKAVQEEMEEVANREGLKGFEKIKAMKLTATQFSVENGMLTPTFKLRRHQARIHFQEDIDKLYASLGD